MKNIILTSISLFIGLTVLNAQSQPDPTNKLNQMKRLENWVGNWKGEGWIMRGPGNRKEFTQTEEVTTKLNGLVLLVNGKGTSKETQETIHDAFAIISYDEQDSTYAFGAYLVNGMYTDATGIWNGNAFEWGFSAPNGGQIKYSINIDEKNWHETGAYSPDGSVWHQFFEMKLEKE